MKELRDATLKLAPEALSERERAAASGAEREEAGFVGVAKHSYGCRVVQRAMEHCALPGWKDLICAQVLCHSRSFPVALEAPAVPREDGSLCLVANHYPQGVSGQTAAAFTRPLRPSHALCESCANLNPVLEGVRAWTRLCSGSIRCPHVLITTICDGVARSDH